MALPPIVFPPSAWKNQHIVLYHGTVNTYVPAILSGVKLRLGKRYTDFGPGFYTTTLLRQARTWAAQIGASKTGGVAAVVRFTIARNDLAKLQALAFVRGDFDADDYWSFVHYCRTGATDHVRTGRRYYDVVYGPVAASWNQRMIIADADQISFHTKAAESVLNKSLRKLMI